MKTCIYLVRHGKTLWNKEHLIQGRTDIPLCEEGKKELINTCERIKSLNIHFDVFLSSPLSRAYDSCLIIRDYLGYNNEIIKRPNLTEREFGDGNKLPITDEVYDLILKDYYSGMEKSNVIKKRALNEIMAIYEKYPNQCILIVTHSHFIKGFFMNFDTNITFKSYNPNGAISYIEIEDGKISNYKFNM